jgi:hypothetical protein
VPARQPMAFNHALHMEADLKCLSCHMGAEDEALAGFPTLADCVDCHHKVQGQRPDEPKVRLYDQQKREIPWVRVNRLPTHVYFPHAAHVTLAKLPCASCHEGIDAATAPLTLPDTHFTMAACMDCHREKKANNDCNACHR